MSSSRKSIIKSDKSKADKLRKRLSFAPDLEEKRASKVTKTSSDASQLYSTNLSAFSSCKTITLGMYYEPKTSRGVPKQHKTIPMKKNTRHDFTSLQNMSPLPKNFTADVMIVGEMIFAEKIKFSLLEAHEKENIKMNLHISCEKDLPEAVKANCVLALFRQDMHESMRTLYNIVEKCTEGSLSSKRVLVVCVSAAEGCYNSVVDLTQFFSLLHTHHLLHLNLAEQSRLDEDEVNKLLEFIQMIVGYHDGATLDYVMNLCLPDSQVDVSPQESASSTI